MANKLKILIVEDEFISRVLLKEMLSSFGDCDMASNGPEAIEALERSYSQVSEKYDLVCLDIMMPRMSGHEVLQELRRIEEELKIAGPETTKVLMVSALDDSKNTMEALVKGRCEAYLTKPISRVRLEEQLVKMQLIEEVS